MSVTSRTPTSASAAHSATTSATGRDTSRPRVCGTMQNAQTLSQPFIAVTNAVTRPRAASGSAPGNTYSSDAIQPVSENRSRPSARASSSGSRRDVVRAEHEVHVRDALQEPLLLLLRDAARHGDERAAARLHLAVAAEGGEQLLLRLLADRAGVEEDEVGVLGRRRAREACRPSSSSIRSESDSFIWQPKVWTNTLRGRRGGGRASGGRGAEVHEVGHRGGT